MSTNPTAKGVAALVLLALAGCNNEPDPEQVANTKWQLSQHLYEVDSPSGKRCVVYSTAYQAGLSCDFGPSPDPVALRPARALAALGGYGVVAVTWSPSPGATAYALKRSSISGGPYTKIRETINTGVVDSTVEPGTSYYYVVQVIGDGLWPDSEQVSATTMEAQ